jgi:hypothetical protein
VTIEKFEVNLVLVNVNKLKPYKCMESEVYKQKLYMLIYWEQNASGLQEEDSDTNVENEDYVKQQP